MHGERFTALCFRTVVSIFLHSPPSPPRIRVTEIPRRINSTDIFTLKGDDFENLIPNEWVTLRAMQALKLCSDAQDKPVMASN